MSPPPACRNCGASVVAGAKFCRGCGSAVEETTADAVPRSEEAGNSTDDGICPACSAPVPAGASFCRACGERQPATGEEEAPTEVRPAAEPKLPPPRGPLPPPPAAHPSPPPKDRSGSPWLLVTGIVVACVLLGGVAGGAAYLLTRDDGDEAELAAEFRPFEAPPPASAEESEADSDSERPPADFSPPPGSNPTERGFPSDSEAQMGGEIEELLRDFHVALVDREFRYAWGLLSSRKRQKEARTKAFSGWKKAQATLSPHLLPGEISVDIDELEDDRVARVMVTGMGWSQPSSPCTEWSGLTWVRFEGGAWRYDPGYSTTSERRRKWSDRSDELLGVGC